MGTLAASRGHDRLVTKETLEGQKEKLSRPTKHKADKQQHHPAEWVANQHRDEAFKLPRFTLLRNNRDHDVSIFTRQQRRDQQDHIHRKRCVGNQ